MPEAGSLGARLWRRVRRLVLGPPIRDTYYRLLERADERKFDRCALSLPHQTPTFSKRVYEKSRGKRFLSRRAAYRDWLAYGRSRGLFFAEDMDTCLKVVLKVKDEAYLLPIWMNYYSRLVGCHNIVILDCGSIEPDYLRILELYRSKVLVFSYPHYYDNIHDTNFNFDFYRLISKNCKYVCVVDTDEFLFGIQDGVIGREPVRRILAAGTEAVYPGTWYANVTVPEEAWTQPLRFGIAPRQIAAGTYGGKAVVRADLCIALGHVGHNLHVAEVAANIRTSACGLIGILHVSNLGPDRARERILKHLKAKNLVPAGLAIGAAAPFLREAIAGKRLSGVGLHYARQFLHTAQPGDHTGETFETCLIGDPPSEPNPTFRRHVEAFDFGAILPAKRAV